MLSATETPALSQDNLQDPIQSGRGTNGRFSDLTLAVNTSQMNSVQNLADHPTLELSTAKEYGRLKIDFSIDPMHVRRFSWRSNLNDKLSQWIATKKTTRQWDAWTHEEEEKFFLALRQVGKNFGKITCHVESKNKDQVRHYYYRLIKRMNKLLSPGFSLDAKNSKDVNAAMLCWWSLLEKHRCSSSKLHLKPRRLKAFVTALEQQLLKDRRKSKKKATKGCSALNTDASDIAEPTFAGDTRKKSGTRNSNSVKRQPQDSKQKKVATHTFPCTAVPRYPENVAGTSESSGLTERRLLAQSSPLDTDNLDLRSNQAVSTSGVNPSRIQSGNLSGEPSKGISSNITGTCPMELQTPEAPISKTLAQSAGMGSEKPVLKVAAVPTSAHMEKAISKLKLQLFPVDELTRTALEQDGHNPHLELTLKGTKSINSVLQHLSQKWGRSSVASGELRLFPFTIQGSISSHCTSWGLTDDGLCAADVHSAVGKPAVFRLRYGWSKSQLPRFQQSGVIDDHNGLETVQEQRIKPFRNNSKNGSPVAKVHTTKEDEANMNVGNSVREKRELREFDTQTSGCTWLFEKSTDGFGQRLWGDEDLLHGSNELAVCGMDWVDSLTVNVSQLLDDPPRENPSAEHQPNRLLASTTSIWGEETRDAFSFRRKEQAQDEVHASFRPLCSRETELEHASLGSNSQTLPSSFDVLRSSALDLYWADSLGALDGTFSSLQGQGLLLNGNSSHSGGISGTLFPDSLDGFPQQPLRTTELHSANDMQMIEVFKDGQD